MKTTEIRQRFLDYFAKQNHEIISSSSLVPGNDPTLLFTNAGMVQFKDLFLGDEVRDYCRATTSQRCVRAGGKHNDLENVGYTARHHTFFEMLGNFSFGDYFKEDAIRFAWELLTEEFGLEKDKLWITVFEEDDEAESIWVDKIGVPIERVAKIGAKDNFWQMGDTGPCGPCSEIFFDHGPEVAGGPPGTPEEGGDRYVEIWNLVFMQFNRSSDGTLHPLPKPSVDTGMGLERVAAVLQGVHSNYEIDLFQNLISATASVLDIEDLDNKSLRVIADHIRSTAFLIADGVIPSNEGRGYVLRRIIRRAIRHGYQAGHKSSFMHRLVEPLSKEMGKAYPELIENQALIERILKQENGKFNETLELGLKILDQEIVGLKGGVIPGAVVFKLYDTFGFPADLTADVAREQNLQIDQAGFEAAMEKQRQRAKSANQFVQGDQIRIYGLHKTPFVGYQNLQCDVEVLALHSGEQAITSISPGESGIVILDQTPFYAQSGGQIADKGTIAFTDGIFEVSDVQYLTNKVIGHFGKMSDDSSVAAKVGTSGNACVETSHRLLNANNHSATHLLHAALQEILGNHVDQKGSLVEPERLRFDFSHFEPVDSKQLVQIEALVNKNIRANHEVKIGSMALDEAKAAGAAALFGEKYDSEVRVVRMGEFSFELCGGTHVKRTGEIGLFKILTESGIAAGIRRIEAISGESAEQFVQQQIDMLHAVSTNLKSTTLNVLDKVNILLEQQKVQEKQIQSLQVKLVSGNTKIDVVKKINNINVVSIRQDDADVKSMRMAVDQWRNKIGSGVVLVAGANESKVTLIAGISKDLNNRLLAGDLIQHLCPLVDGKGGGKADLAQGGGTNTEGIDNAIEAVYQWVEDSL